MIYEELDGPAVSALRCVIAEVKEHWSVIGRVTKNLLSRAPPCFGRHVKPLVPAAFAVVSTHQPALGLRGYGPLSLCAIHEESILIRCCIYLLILGLRQNTPESPLRRTDQGRARR
jgi:hypothetical protein